MHLLTFVFMIDLVSSFSLSQGGNVDGAYIKEHYQFMANSVAKEAQDDVYETMVLYNANTNTFIKIFVREEMESKARKRIRDEVMLNTNNILVEKTIKFEHSDAHEENKKLLKLKESESKLDFIIDDIFNVGNPIDEVNIDLIINHIYNNQEEIDASLIKEPIIKIEEEIFLADEYDKDFHLEEDHIAALTTDQTIHKATDYIDTNDKTGEVTDNDHVDNDGDITEKNNKITDDQTGKMNKIEKEISEIGREINRLDRTLNFIKGKLFINSSLKESSSECNDDVHIGRVYIFHGLALLIFVGFLIIFAKTVIAYKYDVHCFSGGNFLKS